VPTLSSSRKRSHNALAELTTNFLKTCSARRLRPHRFRFVSPSPCSCSPVRRFALPAWSIAASLVVVIILFLFFCKPPARLDYPSSRLAAVTVSPHRSPSAVIACVFFFHTHSPFLFGSEACDACHRHCPCDDCHRRAKTSERNSASAFFHLKTPPENPLRSNGTDRYNGARALACFRVPTPLSGASRAILPLRHHDRDHHLDW